MTVSDIEQVPGIRNAMGESPLWSSRESALYWINVEEEPELLRLDPATSELQRWPMPERIGGFVLKENGGALVVLASGLYDLDFATGQLTLRVKSPLSPDFALHECACDPTGRFWVGSINLACGPDNMTPGGGALFRLDGERLQPVVEDISCANGLAFSPDGRMLYFSDSPTRRCETWNVDARTGEISDRRILFELAPGEGFVDGSTVDREGGYWATLVTGGALRRHLPDGRLDREIKLPFANPTKVAFGGDNLDILYVTSTHILGNEKPGSANGGLFRLRPGIAGCPEPVLPARAGG